MTSSNIKKKKKSNRWWIWLLLALFIGLMVFAYFKNKNKPKGEKVTTEKVSTRTIHETVSASGKIFPEKEIKISSDVSGEIVELQVMEGDSVRAGQLLAKINPDTYLSAVERGNASVNNARSQVGMSQAQIETSKAQIEQIEANLANATKIHNRNIELKNQGVISQADFDLSLSNVNALQANLKSSKSNLNSSIQSSKAAEFTVKSAEASLKELRTSLSRTSIFAPSSGIISKLNVEEGERVVGTIQMAGTEMMRIANLAEMEVQVDVSENDILRVTLGDTADIEVDAYLDKKFKGIVTEIANSASNTGATTIQTLSSDQVTNFVVKIRILVETYRDMISKGGFPFRPGMSAAVEIYTDTRSDIISVPISAVTTREDEKKDSLVKTKSNEFKEYVFLYSADTAKMVLVKSGIQDDTYIQILTGLDGGEEVITGPYATVSRKLKQGMKLQKEDKKDAKNKNGASVSVTID
ncbi:MAG: efflux RND transporter periplasmic adaptor subunit [Saprospiraceae bacterium]|jgi:HlyD family secretion protein|nr:efflux RND transporter periplasmic adaptor subunit [Saprospiraceae bacterium]MBK6479115.1 efflux RND transporter periplasmic adaptor subunit [Saprospiraceae bacterium]MBK6817433.1 efflux RND transporter periplasmic adaptor subunit [Saprospiraceae bacterium]MBK7372831.1 efflux RND transporter periplasmic adaptor subunit [Saprospiraceae bacterium]MBK7439511.1 efflux RND transporter periplasmic adaptor subunit [Saprospiraceae bacterium]